MTQAEATKIMKQSLISGYLHHSYGEEKKNLHLFLTGKSDTAIMDANSIANYKKILGPTSLRSMMNGLICLITVVSRAAIEHGVDAELSFSLSDYYVNEVENQKNQQQLEKLLDGMLEHYANLVRGEQHRTYSLPVTRAIRFIHSKVYTPCRVSEVAEHVNLNAQYFSSLFKKEVGTEPSTYIRKRKMDEAADLLIQSNYSVTDISEILGYCNTGHFINEFKKLYGMTPKQYVKPRV